MNQQLIQLLSSVLLKQVAAGTQGGWWQQVSGSKTLGVLGIVYGIVGLLLGHLTADEATAWVGGGCTAIFLRKGQQHEAEITRDTLHEHLNEQDVKLDKADALLKKDVQLNLARPEPEAKKK